MNKKIIILLVIALLLVLGFGFLIYQYFTTISNSQTPPTENSQNFGQETQPENNIEIGPDGIEVNGGNQGGLVICADKCGDGICQKEDTACEGGNLNCVCQETSADCPQDCK